MHNSQSPCVQLTDVSRHFTLEDGSILEAIKNISFIVERGDIFGIVGMSGAGKSTLLRLLATLDSSFWGSLLVAGREVKGADAKTLAEIRKHIGMIFQQLYLYNAKTVLENVLFPLELRGVASSDALRRARALLARVKLENKENSYPLMLSGGERQRVAIARALVCQPSMLLCDEMTSALDSKSRRSILELLFELNRELGITIILITHEMEVIRRICNKVAVLHQGQIVESGLVDELFAHPHHPVSQELLQHISHEIPTAVSSRELKGENWLLTFKGIAARQPLLCTMIRRFAIDVNILLGSIDRTATAEIGKLLINVQGSSDERNAAKSYLESQGVQCTPYFNSESKDDL